MIAAGCTDRTPGKLLAEGPARDLVASRSGASVAFLVGAAHPDDDAVPQDLYLGDLDLSRGGASAGKVGSGVPSSEGAVAFEPHGEALAFLAGYLFRTGTGELWVAVPGTAPLRLASSASAFAWSPASTGGGLLAFVAARTLHLVRVSAGPGGTASAQELGSGVPLIQTFAWAPGGSVLAARGSTASGGRLVLIDAVKIAGQSAPPTVPIETEVARASSDFSFAPDGALAILGPAGSKGGDRELSLVDSGSSTPRPIASATSYSFSPAATSLALLSTSKNPGEAFGDLAILPRGQSPAPQPRLLGSKVSEWRWSEAGDLLYLARYDLRSRSGTLYALAAGPEAPPRELATRVQSFSVSGGRRVLYLAQEPQKSDFKLGFWTLDLAAAAGSAQALPRKIDEGVYGYELSPDGSLLYWKSRCVGLRSCTLFREPAGGGPPLLLAPQVTGFDLSRDGARLLVAQPHRGSRALDLFLLDARGPAPSTPPQPFLSSAEPGARFLDASGHRVLAAISDPSRAGVVLVDLP